MIFAFAEKTGNWFLIRKSSICFCTIGFFIPAAISEHVRFVRLISLCPPAKMLKSTYGAYEQMESSAVLSAEPLCSYAQMTSAKLVIELPSAENVCVDHRRRNGPNAVRAGLSQSFGENLNAENFFEIFKMKLHETLLLFNKNKKFVLKMQSLRAAKRSMRTCPGSDFAWSFYTAKLHIFSFFLKNYRIIRSILK